MRSIGDVWSEQLKKGSRPTSEKLGGFDYRFSDYPDIFLAFVSSGG